SLTLFIVYFFFQAEDGIRDRNVTGVQTCALPICRFMRHLTRISVDAETDRPVDLGSLPGVHVVRREGTRIAVEVDTEHLDAVVGHLHSSGIRTLTAHPPTLEQLFMRHYGEDIAALDKATHTADTRHRSRP